MVNLAVGFVLVRHWLRMPTFAMDPKLALPLPSWWQPEPKTVVPLGQEKFTPKYSVWGVELLRTELANRVPNLLC